MPERTALMSRKGRIGQRDYGIGVGTLVALRVAMAIVAVVKPDWDWVRHGDFILFFIALVMGKRMRDFGWSALWAFGAVALLSFVLPLVQLVVWPRPPVPSNPLGAVQPLLSLAVTLVLLALIVALGFKKGDPGPNRFGPGPVDPRVAEQIGAF